MAPGRSEIRGTNYRKNRRSVNTPADQLSEYAEVQDMTHEYPVTMDCLRAPRPFSSLVKLELGAVSHPGKKRPNNEDSYVCYRQGRFWEKLDTSLSGPALPHSHTDLAYVMAVADGVGGAAAGEVASSMAITIAVNLVLNAPEWMLKLDNPEFRESEMERGRQQAQEFVRKVDRALLMFSEQYPSLRGMETTLTAARSVGDDLFTLHVGDSRAYLFRGGRLLRLTHDQTMAQAMADQGCIAQDAVPRHWLRHRLTNALGCANGNRDFVMGHTRLLDGDRLLLCTDGLTDMIDDGRIETTMSRIHDSKETCQNLLEQAMDAGGKDNITILIGRYSIPRRSRR